MTLSKETKTGLTFGQIITALTLLVLIIGGWVNVKMDIATLYEKNNSNEIRISETRINMNDYIKDNKQDHKDILSELKELNKKIK